MNTWNKNRKGFLIGGCMAIILCILVLLAILSRHVFMNPPGTIGNTAGNINNRGLFCEHGDTVYFSNPYDGGSLYSMDIDEGHIRKLNSANVCNILAGGRYLYYFQKGAHINGGMENVRTLKSFNRCDLKGRHATGLTRDVVVSGQLVDNYLYLLTSTDEGPSFYKIRIDKKDKTLFEGANINPACAVDGMIYYNGTKNDHYLYALDTATDAASEVWRGNLWYPILEGDYVYYMDVENHYRICRYSLSRDVIEVLTNDRADCFNVGGGYLYYQKNGTDPQLKCMRTDGTGNFVLAEGNYTHINMTSQYVYFQEFGQENTLFHSPLGQTHYSEFTGALDASASTPAPN